MASVSIDVGVWDFAQWSMTKGDIGEVKIKNCSGEKVHLYSYTYNSLQAAYSWEEKKVLDPEALVKIGAGTKGSDKKEFFIHIYDAKMNQKSANEKIGYGHQVKNKRCYYIDKHYDLHKSQSEPSEPSELFKHLDKFVTKKLSHS